MNVGRLEMELHVTSLCNLSCRYCFMENVSEYVEHKHTLTRNELDKVLECISQYEFTELRVEFMGGEPTLSPNLGYIIQKLCELYPFVEIEINTNLYAPIEFFESLPKVNTPIQVFGTYHHTDVKDITGWFEKAASLDNIDGVMFTAILMTSPTLYEGVVEVYRKYTDAVDDMYFEAVLGECITGDEMLDKLTGDNLPTESKNTRVFQSEWDIYTLRANNSIIGCKSPLTIDTSGNIFRCRVHMQYVPTDNNLFNGEYTILDTHQPCTLLDKCDNVECPKSTIHDYIKSKNNL